MSALADLQKIARRARPLSPSAPPPRAAPAPSPSAPAGSPVEHAPVLAIAAAPTVGARHLHQGRAAAYATDGDLAQRVLLRAFDGVGARRGHVDVYTFKPGDITFRDPLVAHASMEFTDATRADIKTLRGRANVAYVARKPENERVLSDRMLDRIPLIAPTREHWQQATAEIRGADDARSFWVEEWFMGKSRAPERIERRAYELMRDTNLARARLR
jgi:hypothetical protein